MFFNILNQLLLLIFGLFLLAIALNNIEEPYPIVNGVSFSRSSGLCRARLVLFIICFSGDYYVYF